MANTPVSDHVSALEAGLKELGHYHYEFIKDKFEGLREAVGEQQELQTLELQLLHDEVAQLKEQSAAKDAAIDALARDNAKLRDTPCPLHDRKPICIRCWKTGSNCDLEPQCSSCVGVQEICRRKTCFKNCRAERCPRVHPGEWVEEQRSMFMEPGRLPELVYSGLGVIKEEDSDPVIKDEPMWEGY